MSLANDGLFRVGISLLVNHKLEGLPSTSKELRHFTPWSETKPNEEYLLSLEMQKLTSQLHVPLGNFVLESRDGVTIACEMCEVVDILSSSFQAFAHASQGTFHPKKPLHLLRSPRGSDPHQLVSVTLVA